MFFLKKQKHNIVTKMWASTAHFLFSKSSDIFYSLDTLKIYKSLVPKLTYQHVWGTLIMSEIFFFFFPLRFMNLACKGSHRSD